MIYPLTMHCISQIVTTTSLVQITPDCDSLFQNKDCVASGGDKGLCCFDKQDDYYCRLMDRKSLENATQRPQMVCY